MPTDVHSAPTYASLISDALRRWPQRTAFVRNRREFTYAEVADRVARTMTVLRDQGLRAGDGVAIVAGNRTDAWTTQAAVLLIGCRFTPLQATSSAEDHAYICRDAEVSVLVFQPDRFSERASHISGQVEGLSLLSLGSSDLAPDLLALSDAASPALLESAATSRDICWLPYTGGTTGRPKGVELPHRSMVHNAFLTLTGYEWPHEVRCLLCTPITHGAGLMIVPTLLKGGTIILQDAFDPEPFAAEVAHNRATAAFVVPTMLYVLLDQPAVADLPLRTLETVIYGASPMSAARMEEALEVFGPVFNQLYGQTEAPNTVTVLQKADHDPRRPHLLASCGKPMSSIAVAVHDEEEQGCGVGETGEIVVRGPLVMDRYWKRPEATAEVLRNGWLHTGDLARRDDEGYLYIVDRAKDMIISGGMNVFSSEVEAVLARHPAVSSVAVIGVPDEKWGEAVKAVVVRKPGKDVAAEELIDLVKDAKGSVHAPKSIDFIAAMPLTPLAKPDKQTLRAAHWAGQSRSVS